ncbi:hypothetical protein CSPX01_11058 [Colletotrichum filicis]|nr:hypothetical protein CSPX01_11058 [Colletotrichum filicis]
MGSAARLGTPPGPASRRGSGRTCPGLTPSCRIVQRMSWNFLPSAKSLMGLIRTPLDNEITKAFAFPKTCTIGMLGSHYILRLSAISVWYMLDPNGISRAA